MESQEHLPSRTARKSTGGKPPPKKSSTSAVASQDDSEIEEISDPITKKKGKAKATESDEDRVRGAAASRKNGKRKATSDDDDDAQVVERPKRQKTKSGRAGSEIKETAARTRTKPSSRATSKQPVAKASSKEKDDSSSGVGADATLKNNPPKKRKINIFPTGNDPIQFSFGGMSNVCFFLIYFFSRTCVC